MTTAHNQFHWHDDQLVNMDNVTEEQKKHVIVALLLIIIAMQLNILQQQRMMMMVMASHFMWVENTIWCIYF